MNVSNMGERTRGGEGERARGGEGESGRGREGERARGGEGERGRGGEGERARFSLFSCCPHTLVTEMFKRSYQFKYRENVSWVIPPFIFKASD